MEGASNHKDVKGRQLFERYGGDEAISGNADARRMDVLDLLLANTDRHAGNVMIREEAGMLRVVAIDNGLTLPSTDSSIWSRWPWGTTDSVKHAALKRWGKIPPGLHKRVKALDLDKVAEMLHLRGIESKAAKACLVRIRALQLNANLVQELQATFPDYDIREYITRMSLKGPGGMLAPAELDKISDAMKRWD